MKLNAIYTITNKENGKVYVGESSDVIQRWHSHRKHLKEGTHNSKKLQADWNKYGEDAFEFKIVWIIDTSLGDAEYLKCIRLVLEDTLMGFYDSIENGYNKVKSLMMFEWENKQLVEEVRQHIYNKDYIIDDILFKNNNE